MLFSLQTANILSSSLSKVAQDWDAIIFFTFSISKLSFTANIVTLTSSSINVVKTILSTPSIRSLSYQSTALLAKPDKYSFTLSVNLIEYNISGFCGTYFNTPKFSFCQKDGILIFISTISLLYTKKPNQTIANQINGYIYCFIIVLYLLYNYFREFFIVSFIQIII